MHKFQPSELKQKKFGYNISLHAGDFYVQDSDYWDEVRKLSPNTLRFPGGEISNFYHWKDSSVDSAFSESSERARKLMLGLSKKHGGVIDFKEFMNQCMHNGIKPLLVVNMYTGSVNEVKEWAEFVKKRQYDIIGWELGNELYLPKYREKIKSVEQYSKRAKKYAEAIKEVDSTFRVSVNSSPSDFKVEPDYFKVGLGNWNAYLSTQDYYDAYTLHVYLRPQIMYGDSIVLKADTSQLHELMRSYSEKAFERIDYYDTIFDSKPMWLTEWNIHDKLKVYPESYFHQLWYLMFSLKIEQADYIETSYHHVLSSKKNGFPLFIRSSKGEVKYMPNYEIGQLLSSIYNSYSFRFDYPPTQENVYVMGFGKSENDVENILVLNYSSKDLNIIVEENDTTISYGLLSRYSYREFK